MKPSTLQRSNECCFKTRSKASEARIDPTVALMKDDVTLSREDQEFTEHLHAATSEIGAAVKELLYSWEDKPSGPPPILFHFTDTAGLVGILSNRSLLATLATALNDTSETQYAISRF